MDSLFAFDAKILACPFKSDGQKCVGEFCLAWEWSSEERQQTEMERGNCRKRRMRFLAKVRIASFWERIAAWSATCASDDAA